MASWSYGTLDDVPYLVDLMFEAFNGPFFNAIFPDNEGGRAFIRRMYEACINPPPAGQPCQDRKLVVVRDNDGKVLSSVVYFIVKPDDKGLWQWKKRFPAPTPEMGLDEGKMDAFFAVPEGLSAKFVGEQCHIYVESAVTLTDHQRKGYMTTLLKMGNQLADDLDYPLFLVASPAGQPGYLNSGYEVLQADAPGPMPMLRKKKSERA
ncbi:hypothetical protein GQ53DRAFT_835592 [Thozetella sp. PMI_491]|nr:hypothetical protein GQ53DRAFT_835592 [Thozetella sp. PMI_491]